MTSDEKTNKRVKKMNDWLAVEIGSPPPRGVGEVYQWIFSENLMVDKRSNRTGSGIWLAQPTVETRKMCMLSDHQWILCRVIAGRLCPCGGTEGIVQTAKYKAPTWEDTHTAAALIKDMLGRTTSDFLQLINHSQELRDKATYDTFFDMFADVAPGFGGNPGKKEHWAPVKGTRDEPLVKLVSG